MALVLDVKRVQYICRCGVWEPLCRLYFCRHCNVLRCRECVTHEVDSIFCANCLENMPTAEARVKKNRCGNCFQCPWCRNSLTLRVHSLLPPGTSPSSDADQPQTPSATPGPKKVYYLSCNFCRWTTRDAAIPDQSHGSSGWPEKPNPDEKMLNAVLDQFRQMASVEKADRERKKYTKRRSLSIFSDKYGLQALVARRRLGFGMSEKDPVTEDVTNDPEEEVPELPDSFFTESVVLDSITTLEQRHCLALTQPRLAQDLYPQRKPLSVRRSLRCKECDHNLCKGEYNPSSIKFKIQLFAMLHVPDIRLLNRPVLVPGQPCEVQLSVSNLTQALMHLVLLPNAAAVDEKDVVKVDIPVVELVLPVRDDTADLEESGDQNEQFKDDPSVVCFRRGHKLGIRLFVTPELEEAKWLTFILKYDYVNTVMGGGGDAREPDITWLQQTVKIDLSALAAIASF